MNVRKLAAYHGFNWMRDAVNAGARNPRAVLGSAALFLFALYLAGAISVLPVAWRLQGRAGLSFGESLAAAIPLLIVLALLVPILLAGLFHIFDDVEHGRPARARDLFAAFRQGRVLSLMGLGVVQVMLNALGIMVVVAVLGPDYFEDSLRAMQEIMAGRQPPPPSAMPSMALLLLAQVLQLTLNYLSVVLMMLCVPLISLSRLGFLESIRAGLRASIVNLAPNLVASIIFLVGFLIASLMVAVVSAVAGAVGALVHPLLGGAIALAFWLVFMLAALVVVVAGSYFAWRDMFDALPPSSGPAGIEA